MAAFSVCKRRWSSAGDAVRVEVFPSYCAAAAAMKNDQTQLKVFGSKEAPAPAATGQFHQARHLDVVICSPFNQKHLSQ